MFLAWPSQPTQTIIIGIAAEAEEVESACLKVLGGCDGV